MKRKFFAAFLSLCMVMSLVPMTGLAAETTDQTMELSALKEALTEVATKENKTVSLTGNVTITAEDLTGLSMNGSVITVPADVTLNGNSYTITASGWTEAEKNSYHILSVENASEGTTTTIKDLTIVGNANTKSGIHAYNCAGEVKLENVNIQNCGNAAVQINGAKVTAENLTTSGNAWGGVNVDDGSTSNPPSFTLSGENNNLTEPTKIWTELTPTENDPIITVPEEWTLKEFTSVDGKTYWADTSSIRVGSIYYPTLQDAVKAIQDSPTEKTITLEGNVTVTQVGSLTANQAAVTLPAGVTLDGQDNQIIAIADWDKTKNNHILGVVSPTNDVTIKDVTIVGNANTKHGINAYGTNNPDGKLNVQNVTIKNCGTAGMVVNGMTVEADRLTTSGNEWGAVNVDDAANSKLTLTDADLAEDVQVWTEKTTVDEDTIVINDTDFSMVTGAGYSTDTEGLKGFTYYTTDPSKLGEASITTGDKTTVYKTLAEAINAAQGSETIELLKDVNLIEALTIEKGLTIDGNSFAISYTGNGLTNGAFITVQGENGDNVTLKSLTVNTNGKAKHGVQFYCVTNGELNDVTVNGGSYTSVIVNGSEVTLTNCVLNPDANAYTNIEYAMGSNVTAIPKITLNNVQGEVGIPFVYADQNTANRVIANSNGELESNATAESIAKFINTKLTGVEVTLVSNGNVEVPGTQVYTISFDTNGHGSNPADIQTNSAGNLVSKLPTLSNDGRYHFDGWFTDAIGGEQVNQDTVFTENTTLYAHWTYMAPPANPNYKITIGAMENGTVTANPTAAKAGATVTLTPVPDEGYALSTLTVTDRFGDAVRVTENSDGTYTFTMPNGQVTVNATFVETEEPVAEPFVDVAEGDWFYDAVVYAYQNELMDGVGGNRFAPNSETTRAQLVTILYRLEGQPAVSGDLPFTDVESGTWYTDAILWAAQNNIVNGVSDTEFAPGDDLTRQQLVTILYRYAEAKGYDVSASADLSGYPDADQVQAYAQPAMAWAVAENIIQGMEDGTLKPAGNASRAQIATILMRFCEDVAQ